MPQDRDSGDAARIAGLLNGRALARWIGATVPTGNSNLCELGGSQIVVKTARASNDRVGITEKMLGEIESVVAAFATKGDDWQVWRLSPDLCLRFRSASLAARKRGQVHVERSVFERHGIALGRALFEANADDDANRIPIGESLELVWPAASEAKGYIDAFPPGFFFASGNGLCHTVRSKEGSAAAYFDLSVAGNTATLNYRPYAKKNSSEGLIDGSLELTFVDETRTLVSSAHWTDETGSHPIEFGNAAVQYAPAVLPPFDPTVSAVPRKRAAKEVALRPDQSRFRTSLMRAYGGRCCVSGCAVAPALVAAHLISVASNGIEHPQNGLLLRADIHALLDAGLIHIDADCREIRVSPKALPEYASFVGGKLRDPEKGYTHYAPTTAVLRVAFPTVIAS